MHMISNQTFYFIPIVPNWTFSYENKQFYMSVAKSYYKCSSKYTFLSSFPNVCV